MVFKCERGHETVSRSSSDYICCPQIEQSKMHYNFGRVCGRLAFAWLLPEDRTAEEEKNGH